MKSLCGSGTHPLPEQTRERKLEKSRLRLQSRTDGGGGPRLLSRRMSHWGARTGYSYEAQRVSFLREMYRNERRQRELDLSPRDRLPGMAMLQASMARSPALSAQGQIFGQPPVLSPLPGPHVPSPSGSPSKNWPAISTTAMTQFCPHDKEFLERFRAGREHGKPHDKNTDYREQVFQIWNISGVKSPAVFR